MYIQCPKCLKEYNAVPFESIKRYKRIKCLCKHVFERPIFEVLIEGDDNKFDEIEEWLKIENLVWAYNWQMANKKNGGESMEDILASIRRILSDDEKRTFVFFNKKDALHFKLVWL
jgi:hypothetical protein